MKMKKKEFFSKLKLQKTIIVSFNSVKNINGGTFQRADAHVLANNFISNTKTDCLSLIDCYTNEGKYSCLSCTGTECIRPTNTKTDNTDFCYGNNPTQLDCTITCRGNC